MNHIGSLLQRVLDIIEIGEIANRGQGRFAMDLASDDVNFLAPNLHPEA
ncbi:MAG: hypothetical protein Q7J20_12555 [Candidatus Nitrotoga sp.]|nr:hypothetical protein [Candidatus Nitrotoga sp.]MDO9448697.1 hypothetical protein [Candidatus Nitrotoga sp.]MDP3497814.1 hypothetical protein [Candidatus Nitrotoga sp.]